MKLKIKCKFSEYVHKQVIVSQIGHFESTMLTFKLKCMRFLVVARFVLMRATATKYFICFDSQASFMALQRQTSGYFPFGLELLSLISILFAPLLTNIKSFSIGHSNIPMNEMVDDLMRMSSMCPFVGTEHSLGISTDLIQKAVSHIFRKTQHKNWRRLRVKDKLE